MTFQPLIKAYINELGNCTRCSFTSYKTCVRPVMKHSREVVSYDTYRNYDVEVCAIQETAKHLLDLNLSPRKVVFLIDIQAAITALSNNNSIDCPIQVTIQCRNKQAELITSGWTLQLQWVPSHAQVLGNNKAGVMVSIRAESN
ncbi:reverse transcriptase [Nephila pilipes]|uniref:Reverse transcriptase n=1 Tax=Nephila pilipes TaxID=299642 RepID=A0A8X6MVG7_NEPPI|nr:reverse transcriptase [Nephila pilipes]